MDRQATKTREELEQEEAARLVRPAPKFKPPRRDRRRERDDSDKEVDPDEAADRKDRSDNYKDVGGSEGSKGRISPLVRSIATRYAISSYSTSSLMASVSEKAAVYNGVAPYKETPGYVPWTQPAQRDLGEGDFEVILKSAKDWLTTPVLAIPMVDANRDIQLRAALDLAIYQGPYNGAIQPNIYNDLLARLAGVDGEGTLLTQRAKNAGWSYATDNMTVAMWGKNPVNIDVVRAIYDAEILFDDDEGEPHQERALKPSNVKSGKMLTYVEEKQGLLGESTIRVDFPEGADSAALVALKAVGRKFGLQVEKVAPGYTPTFRGKLKPQKEYVSPLLRGRHATDKVATMKASNEIRKLAAKYAAQDAALAYDLMDLASKVADDEQGQDDDQSQQKQAQDQKPATDKYAGLRSAVITAASKNPEARAAFIPVLQAIKSLDV